RAWGAARLARGGRHIGRGAVTGEGDRPRPPGLGGGAPPPARNVAASPGHPGRREDRPTRAGGAATRPSRELARARLQGLMACLFCGSRVLAPLYEGIRDHYGVAEGTHRFLRCEECGSATLDPLPTPERLLALYSSDYTFKHAPEEGGGVRGVVQRMEGRCF